MLGPAGIIFAGISKASTGQDDVYFITSHLSTPRRSSLFDWEREIHFVSPKTTGVLPIILKHIKTGVFSVSNYDHFVVNKQGAVHYALSCSEEASVRTTIKIDVARVKATRRR